MEEQQKKEAKTQRKTKKMKSETAVWPFCVVVGDTHSGSLTVAPQRLRLHGDGEIMRSGSAEAWS